MPEKMPAMVRMKSFPEERGTLTVIENDIPFPIKRVFYTYGVPAGTVRGGHGHKKTSIGLVAAAGACTVSGATREGASWSFRLDNPEYCLVLEPGNWHQMFFDLSGTVLLCLASETYDPEDYFYERPNAAERPHSHDR